MDGNLPGAATRYLRFTGFRGGFHLQHRAGLDATSRTYNLYPLPVCLSACKPEKSCCRPASTVIRACLLCSHLQKMMVCSLYPEQDSELRWYSIKKCEVFHSSLCLPSGIAQILFFIFFFLTLYYSTRCFQTRPGPVECLVSASKCVLSCTAYANAR